MKSRSLRLAPVALFLAAPAQTAVIAVPAVAAAKEKPLVHIEGERDSGKIIATFARPGTDGVAGRYIYITQLESGLGSAPIGLDRAAASESRILVFRRIGKKLIAEVENSKFVASSGEPLEGAAVRDSFANSTLWMGDIADTKADGSFTADIAGFLARDDLNIVSWLKRGGGGDFKLVPELSVADPGFVKLFPRNAELSARLTFRSDDPTAEIDNILSGGQTFSIALRHSLIALPEPGYVSRSDPFGFSYGRQQVDFSAPLGSAMVKDLARRFRLEKVDPSAARSEVKKPIVFYVDRAAPEPVRTALREGVDWWRAAFDSAGFVNAFRTEILPEGADPLDVRYNVVNWVNRATRGWSYGQAIDDPRTGEIIKGSVLLGSLRVRQDLIIFQALVGAGLTGTGAPDDPITAALARIRQLGAHEVGHAIGLAHNFAASSQGRYSVMDYPAPRILLSNGQPTLGDAYGIGVGTWDRWVVQWLYGAKTDAEARPMVAQARAQGLRFVGDNDARPVGASQPDGGLWDDFGDPVAELRRMMEVRRVAVSRFGEAAIPAGESLSGLRRAFVPIWLLHRYQVESAAKYLGGVTSPYALSGEGLRPTSVPGAHQAAALYALLDTLNVDALEVPRHLQLILSSGTSTNSDRQTEIELIPTAGGPVFDPLKATEVGVVQTLNSLLAPERLNRLEIQHSADSSVPSPAQVFDLLIDRSLARSESDTGRRIATTSILALARVQRNSALSPTIALALASRLDRLAQQLERTKGRDMQGDWARGLADLLQDREALDKAIADPGRLPRVPPGMPIG